MRIILSGGGTGGSVSPILAIAEEIKKQYSETEFLFIGTKKGVPEKELVKTQKIPYQSIYSGKLRRYLSWRNCVDPFLILMGFFQSFFIILKYKPKAVISAGGFVAVPLSWAGWFCRVPVFIHQQDIIPGLANKLIAPLAKKITVSFEKSLENFNKKKTILTGNPVRPWILQGDKSRAIKRFNLEHNLPVLLVIGGGTGAQEINELIIEIVSQLIKFCQIIQVTGRDKQFSNLAIKQFNNRYHQYDFLNQDIADAYAAADLVVSRAGMGVLTELSVLGKPGILIPISDSHQQANAQYFAEQKAVVLLNQKNLTSETLLNKIHSLIVDDNQRAVLSLNILKLGHLDAAKKIANLILNELA